MKKFFNNLFESFSNSTGGYSARKLSAFASVMIAIWITYKHSNDGNVESLVLIWLGFGLICLSIVTVDQLIQLRTGIVTTKTKTETTEKTTTT